MENQQQQPEVQQEVAESVGFPTSSPRKKGGMGKWVISFILVLLVFVGGVFFLLKGSSGGNSNSSPTPTSKSLGASATSTPSTPTPNPTTTSTPKASSKKELKIQILNGSGITGDAGVLQSALRSLGYSDIKTGNAPSQNVTETTFSYTKSVTTSVVSEIKAKLEATYKTVEADSVSSIEGGFDIQIVTGAKKASAATSSPSSSPTAKPTPTSTP